MLGTVVWLFLDTRIYVVQIRFSLDMFVHGKGSSMLWEFCRDTRRSYPQWALGNVGTIFFAFFMASATTRRRIDFTG